MAKRIFRAFKLDEISGVDYPCQEGARALIIKRAAPAKDAAPELTVLKIDDSAYMRLTKRTFSQAQRDSAEASGAAMPGGRYPIENKDDLKDAIRAVGRGKGSHAAIRAHIMRRARSLGAEDMIPDDWKSEKALAPQVLDLIDATTRLYKALSFNDQQATEETTEFADGLLDEIREATGTLRTVFYEIAGDDSVTDKPAAMQQALVEFSEHVKSIAPEGIETGIVAAAMQQAGFTVNEQGGVELTKSGAEDMKPIDLAKALGVVVAKDASDEAILKAIADHVNKAKKKEDEEGDDVEKLKKYVADIEKMSGKHKDFMSGGGKMPKGGKTAFAAMTPEERDDHMDSNPLSKAAEEDDPEEVEKKLIKKGLAFKDTSTGVVIYKKDFSNADHFRVMKANSERAAAQALTIAKMQEDSAKGTIAKSVDGLKHVGKSEDVTALIHKISKSDPEAGAAVLKLVGDLDSTIEKSGLLGEVGSAAQGRVGKAATSIETQAQKLLTDKRAAGEKNWTIEKARVAIRKSNPELRKQEEDEAAEQRSKSRKRAA